MQLITAPSKTQRFNKRVYAEHSHPVFLDKAQVLINRLKLYKKSELAKLMKLSNKLADSTHQRIHNFEQPFSRDNAKQAIFSFQGDVYSTIAALDYNKDQLDYAQRHLIILSGLYGILRPLDLMQPYRLEMACSLSTGSNSNLYQFWQYQVTEFINRSLSKSDDQRVINLASQEYSRVVNRKKLQGQMVTISFKQNHKGRLRTIPIFAKRARGMMIHHSICNQITDSEKLKEFQGYGYCFSEEDSTATEWFFYKNND